MPASTFRKPLLSRAFSIERLGSALAPKQITQDADGFESVDSYFPENENELDNKSRKPLAAITPTRKAAWRVEPSPVKNSASQSPIEYEVAVNHDDNYDGDTEMLHVASPDVEDQEIVFKRSIKPRPSLGNEDADQRSPTAQPKLTRKKTGSGGEAKKAGRKRSLLPDPLVSVAAGLEALDDEGNDAARRSNRKRFSPLAFWRNERVVYGRRNSSRMHPNIVSHLLVGMPVIVDVVKKPSSEDNQQRKKKRKRTSAIVKKPKLDAFGVVKDFESKQEIETQLALSGNLIKGDEVPGADFFIHTVFVEGSFMSSGVLVFPKDSVKPSRNSSKHALVFFVVQGTVEVTVHRTTFVVHPECMFYVPRGNQYAIKNIADGESRLFFCHCKDTFSNNDAHQQ